MMCIKKSQLAHPLGTRKQEKWCANHTHAHPPKHTTTSEHSRKNTREKTKNKKQTIHKTQHTLFLNHPHRHSPRLSSDKVTTTWLVVSVCVLCWGSCVDFKLASERLESENLTHPSSARHNVIQSVFNATGTNRGLTMI
jgi:hypothetical protein